MAWDGVPVNRTRERTFGLATTEKMSGETRVFNGGMKKRAKMNPSRVPLCPLSAKKPKRDRENGARTKRKRRERVNSL